jgi:hypothetical protein
VRWKQELNSVVTELNSIKENIKIDSVGMEVPTFYSTYSVGTIQSKNNVSDYSEDDWNLMNQKYATKQRNRLRYIPVPVVSSNCFSILEFSQHTFEIVGEQPPITSS